MLSQPSTTTVVVVSVSQQSSLLQSAIIPHNNPSREDGNREPGGGGGYDSKEACRADDTETRKTGLASESAARTAKDDNRLDGVEFQGMGRPLGDGGEQKSGGRAMEPRTTGQHPSGARVWAVEASGGLPPQRDAATTCKGKTRGGRRVGWEMGQAVEERVEETGPVGPPQTGWHHWGVRVRGV